MTTPARRLIARERGLCTSCTTKPAQADRLTCVACVASASVRRTRAVTAARASTDTCTHCASRDRIPGRRMCERCTEIKRNRLREKQKAKRLRGECARCIFPATQGVLCDACAEQNRATARAYYQAKRAA